MGSGLLYEHQRDCTIATMHSLLLSRSLSKESPDVTSDPKILFREPAPKSMNGADPRPAKPPTVSFEFFPPKSVRATNELLTEIARLDRLDPSFISVTYGAGGTTRTRTDSLVCGLSAMKDYPVMPHLTAIGHTTADVKEIMDSYVRAGVENVLVVAGDPPEDGAEPVGDFRHAADLVDELRGLGDFGIGVAAFPEVHPRSSSRRFDRIHLADKLHKADFGITQFFFDPEDYFRMIGELTALGCSTPVVPGVIPVTRPNSVARFAEMNGAKVPTELFSQLDAASPEDRIEIAVDHAAQLTASLLDAGVPGVHFYTLNEAEVVTRVIRECGLR